MPTPSMTSCDDHESTSAVSSPTTSVVDLGTGQPITLPSPEARVVQEVLSYGELSDFTEGSAERRLIVGVMDPAASAAEALEAVDVASKEDGIDCRGAINAVNGMTLLFYAARRVDDESSRDVCRGLIKDYRLDPHVVDRAMRQTALFYAALLGHALTIDLFLSLGVRAALTDVHSQTALYYCSREGHVEAMRRLLDASPSGEVNHRDCNGQTALYYAAKTEQLEACICLVEEYGCDPCAVDTFGVTARSSAPANSEVDHYLKRAESGLLSSPVDGLNSRKRKGSSGEDLKLKLAPHNPPSSNVRRVYRLVRAKGNSNPSSPALRYLPGPLQIGAMDSDEAKPPSGDMREKATGHFRTLYPIIASMGGSPFWQPWRGPFRQLAGLLKRYVNGWIFHKVPDDTMAPGYSAVVADPIDLSMICHKLDHRQYAMAEQVDADIRRMFSNSYLYNGRDSTVGLLTRSCEVFYEQQLHGMGLPEAMKAEEERIGLPTAGVMLGNDLDVKVESPPQCGGSLTMDPELSTATGEGVRPVQEEEAIDPTTCEDQKEEEAKATSDGPAAKAISEGVQQEEQQQPTPPAGVQEQQPTPPAGVQEQQPTPPAGVQEQPTPSAGVQEEPTPPAAGVGQGSVTPGAEAPVPPWNRLKRKSTGESSSPRQTESSAHPRVPTPASDLERTDVFEITSGLEALPPFPPWTPDNKPKTLRTHAPKRMREGLFCESSVVDELWEEKTRMDRLFDRGQGRIYHRVRARVFPSTISGSANVGISNRAGDKLWEVLEALDIWPSVLRLARSEEGAQDGEEDEMKVRYVDVCGGPGAFSELVKNLGERENVKTVGRGMSLKIDSAQSKEASCIWYQHLLDSEDFDAVWGPDGDGNVYSPGNLLALEESVGQVDPRGAHLVMGDGGFEVSKDKEGNHLENYQEIYSARIILSEILTMVRACAKGGFLVCKLFDTFSTITASVIYVIARLFDKCYIVKPQRSRVVNSERYLVGFGFKGRENPDFDVLTRAMEFCHSTCFSEDEGPESVVPVQLMEADRKFHISLSQSIRELALRQTRALDILMNAVDEEVATGKGGYRKGGKGGYRKGGKGGYPKGGKGFYRKGGKGYPGQHCW
ncbi:FtsJ methyltransferase domain-containing protein 2 [Perkinsus olseni]|uniref:Cap-specific mRNA (nucleoside-2'-O-)-methyltransferase 1 n=1 Tax=Perkinsus olseni TaxID=32597 RepID=A0A7J6L218_PEROL|nr:FtsJ methyltransferase domain-containing protein 2 [Perkinsus olseni]